MKQASFANDGQVQDIAHANIIVRSKGAIGSFDQGRPTCSVLVTFLVLFRDRFDDRTGLEQMLGQIITIGSIPSFFEGVLNGADALLDSSDTNNDGSKKYSTLAFPVTYWRISKRKEGPCEYIIWGEGKS